MPGKNLEKLYVPHTYYHIYNRGVEKRDIFLDEFDYIFFLSLFKRYLSARPEKDSRGREYPHYSQDVDLLAYCLMPNHFHMLIYVHDNPTAMIGFLQSLMTTYSMGFNKKHRRVGPLFQQRYRAVMIQEDDQLWHISRYIHLNPISLGSHYIDYPYSSIGFYTGNKNAEWLKHHSISDMFKEGRQDYLGFLHEYESRFHELKEIEQELI